MKTSELTSPALDWAVATCFGYIKGDVVIAIGNYLQTRNDEGQAVQYSPSTDWSQGGPIIEREGLRIERRQNTEAWVAQHSETTLAHHGAFRGYFRRTGPTPLIAAMRCYVASELGDEVDVPKELL